MKLLKRVLLGILILFVTLIVFLIGSVVIDNIIGAAGWKR